jgi:hypothetical protein
MRVYAADSSEVGFELFSRVQVMAAVAVERRVDAATKIVVRMVDPDDQLLVGWRMV